MTVKKKQFRKSLAVDDIHKVFDEIEDNIVENEPESIEEHDPKLLMKLLNQARKEAYKLQDKIDDLEKERDDAQDELSEQENEIDAFRNRLTALTDRSNWNGNTWSPVMPMMAGDIVDFIESGRAPLH